jgi:putative serine protease PepD
MDTTPQYPEHPEYPAPDPRAGSAPYPGPNPFAAPAGGGTGTPPPAGSPFGPYTGPPAPPPVLAAAGAPGDPSGPPHDSVTVMTPGDPAPRPRGKRRAVAVVAAVALAAGLAGGVAGGVIGDRVGDHGSPSAAYSAGAAPVQSVADKSQTGVAAVASAVTPSVVEVTVQTRQGTGTGSGVVLTADGKILTNAHVVDGAGSGAALTVTFSDGKTADATVVGKDTSSDLAVIQAKGVSNLKAATLGNSSQVAVGDQVVAIGSPEGLTGTVTSGIVSALDREVTVSDSNGSNGSNGSGGLNGFPFGTRGTGSSSSNQTTYHAIQTDAAINPGNSGGPLLDMNGRVIGINSAIYSPTSAGGSDAGNVGLGFAIPIDQVKTLLPGLESGQSA